MNLRRVALLAAIGVVLRGLPFLTSNLIPSWEASEWGARFAMLVTAVIGPLAWAGFFVAIWRGRGVREAAIAAAVANTLEVVLVTQRQYLTFSALSLDTVGFVFGMLVPALCWLLLLMRFAGLAVSFRSASMYLMLVCIVQFGLVTYEFIDSFGQIRAFWSIEPGLVTRRLIATPLIWMYYWITQALFLRSAQKS